jgi:photosystem II stability/assembly factor-like uncharacterized protein
MNDKTFLATTGQGIARAACEVDEWVVAHLLPDEKVACLTADPHNRNIIYAGTQGNGVWWSQDNGRSWQPLSLSGHIIKALAVSPHEPGVIYAGTKPALMFVSRDNGHSWTELTTFRQIRGRWLWFSPAEPPDKRAYVQAIAISPTDPNVVMAGIEFGATIRSEDGGQTWSNHVRGTLRDCHSMTFHAREGWAYEAGGSGGGASVSRDNGRTWHKAKRGLAKNYGVACAADPEKPEIWYVSVAPNPRQAYGQNPQAYLYRAAGGADWQPIGWEPHPMKEMPITLLTDPQAPGHLYVGTVHGSVWHSADYGDSWHQLPFNLQTIWRTLIMIH